MKRIPSNTPPPITMKVGFCSDERNCIVFLVVAWVVGMAAAPALLTISRLSLSAVELLLNRLVAPLPRVGIAVTQEGDLP